MRHLILACVALTTLAAAFAPPAAAQDAKAAEVLARTRKALGVKKVDSLSVDALMQRNVGERQSSTEVELHVQAPDKYVRTDVSSAMMGVEITTGFNGDTAILPGNASMAPGGMMMIRIGPGGPAAAGHEAPKLTPEQKQEVNLAQLRAQRTEISRLMLGWLGMAHPSLPVQYTYAGEAESPDGKAHVIDVKGNDGFAARLFIDQNNHLPLMVTYQGRQPRMVTSTRTARQAADAAQEMQKLTEAPPPLVEFSLFFDDWREVDGIRFPHVMRKASEGATTEEWTINKVKVNSSIDAKKFAADAK